MPTKADGWLLMISLSPVHLEIEAESVHGLEISTGANKAKVASQETLAINTELWLLPLKDFKTQGLFSENQSACEQSPTCSR